MLGKHRSLSLVSAVTFLLSRRRPQWLAEHDLGVTLWQAWELGIVAGRPVRKPKGAPSRRHYVAVRQALLADGLLRPVPADPTGSAYRLIGAQTLDAETIVCGLDPFAHLSYLSAMHRQGLTSVHSKTIHALTLPTRKWRSEADRLMCRRLGPAAEAYRHSDFPWLRPRRVASIAGRPVSWAGRDAVRHFKWDPTQQIRITPLGMTFLDMLRAPEWCGGMDHVRSVYAAHARGSSAVIVAALERHGNAIDKARAGYMLEEICGLVLPEVDGWAAAAQRGGSRRLVATRPYASQHSARWGLSLNA